MEENKKEKKLYVKRVHFDKYASPYGDDIEEGEHKINIPLDEESEEEVEVDATELMSKSMKMLQTPLGIIPLTEHTNPSKIFNFWVGHTNFPVTKSMGDKIESTLGVELYLPLSPYRFRIGIAKLFEEQDVMESIKAALLGTEYDILELLQNLK